MVYAARGIGCARWLAIDSSLRCVARVSQIDEASQWIQGKLPVMGKRYFQQQPDSTKRRPDRMVHGTTVDSIANKQAPKTTDAVHALILQ